MITMNAPTSYAYIQLRKNTENYKILRERLLHSDDPAATLRMFVGSKNRMNIWTVGDVFPDPERIDYRIIMAFWEANLPMNSPEKLRDMGIKAERYTGLSG